MKFGFTFLGVLAFVGLMYFALAPKTAETPVTGSTPTTTMAAKINIDAVCQGALAYMTFPSSVEADAFIQECKDGKHPEVIEQWKQQQGIQDDMAI